MIGLASWAIWYWYTNRDDRQLRYAVDHAPRRQSPGSGGMNITMSVGGQRVSMSGSTHVTNAQFICQGEPVELHGRSIPSPMLYVTKRADGNLTNPGVIDLSLSVAQHSPNRPPELPYWPSYGDMSPAQRASYLDWLAGGRQHRVPMGYAFVFFYGLERRLLTDQDRGPIRSELHRLLSIYGENRSFRSYATRLLTFDAIRNLEGLDERELDEAFPLHVNGHSSDRQTLSARLTWYAANKKPLPVELAFVTAERDPRTTNSVVTNRVRNEATKLFAKRYEQQYGAGQRLRIGSKTSIDYRPASSTLSYEAKALGREDFLEASLNDPLSNTKQFAPIANMLEECIDGLRSYSRAVGGEADGEMTSETWEKLPPELKAEVPHPHEARWLGVVRKYLNENGIVEAPAGSVAKLCGISERDKLTRSQCRSIASTATGLGFAVEPDPHLLPQSWAWEDTVSLVQIGNATEKQHSRYDVAALLAYLAVYIAGADGSVDPQELAVIRETVNDMFELHDLEKRRLEALMTALADANITMRGVSKRIDKHLSKGQRKHLAELLVMVAVADGVLDKDEKTYLKRAYNALDLNPDEAIRKAEAMIDDSSALSDPVSVRQASEDSSGEAIPQRPDEKPGEQEAPPVQLDARRISQIRRETREVADMLGKALSEESDAADDGVETQPPGPPPTPAAVDASEPDNLFAELDDRYQPFVEELVERPEWSADELQELARSHRLMVGAAVSVVNEWSDEHLGEFLIEDSEPYKIRTSLLQEEILA
jgi:uncharacterized tellurite resistance protein B-like protein